MVADTETNIISVERIDEYATSNTEAEWNIGEMVNS